MNNKILAWILTVAIAVTITVGVYFIYDNIWEMAKMKRNYVVVPNPHNVFYDSGMVYIFVPELNRWLKIKSNESMEAVISADLIKVIVDSNSSSGEHFHFDIIGNGN